ncbi:hypothetical protein ABMA27_009969 [Loxostege sticticalis]|uniref:RNase NYN domain-containing protein n=2 Tax=Loxostege sticticalis TaxID=481309 RepID=A0ABR3H760_LOXSC
MAGIKDNPLNSKKLKNKKKRKHRKKKDQIKRLFEKLRNESDITLNDETENHNNSTVIVLDDTIKECPKKRKISETLADQVCKKANNQSVIIADNDVFPRNSKPLITEKNSVQAATTDPVIIADDVEFQTNSECSSSKKRKLLATDIKPVIVPDNDVLQINPEPCSSKTPRKKGIAPPMNCSTPLAKSNTDLVGNNNADGAKNLNIDLNQTKVINRDSYLTIDLTTDSDLSRLQCNTVIDLDNTQESQDCTLVSISNASSMSGDSQVTVLHKNSSRSKRMDKFVNGIAKLDASEKGKLLEMITQKIFNGCKVPEKLFGHTSRAVETVNEVIEPAETTYIKEVILGQKKSRNSIGSNIYNPEKDNRYKQGLRMIVIDGSNVAMQHSKGRIFSVRGLKICIEYFLKRGHTVKAFVPHFRCKFGKSSDPRLLDDLERLGYVVYTPSREIQGKLVASYDDRYIVQCAAEFDGVIVTGDNYRDLLQENPRWRFVIENRLLPFTWVNDMIMFPRDPLGRNGPTLEQFLRHPAPKSIPSKQTIVL